MNQVSVLLSLVLVACAPHVGLELPECEPPSRALGPCVTIEPPPGYRALPDVGCYRECRIEEVPSCPSGFACTRVYTDGGWGTAYPDCLGLAVCIDH